jgi:hypothetical protein
MDTGLKETAIEAFQTSLRGELLHEGNAAYEDARKIHNGFFVSLFYLHKEGLL